MAHRDDSEWLTLGQAARFLGVAQSTIRKWSDNGRVPAFYTPGGHRRYRRADLEAFLDRSGPGGRPKTGPLVLLVDDDEKVRELVRVNLEFEGYTVREAASASEGLDAIEEAKPDLVLLDVMMPKISGFEVCKRLRADPATAAVGVLMVTALDQPSDIERAIDAGTDDFVTRPVNKTELLLRVKALLGAAGEATPTDRALAYLRRVQQGV